MMLRHTSNTERAFIVGPPFMDFAVKTTPSMTNHHPPIDGLLLVAAQTRTTESLKQQDPVARFHLLRRSIHPTKDLKRFHFSYRIKRKFTLPQPSLIEVEEK